MSEYVEDEYEYPFDEDDLFEEEDDDPRLTAVHDEVQRFEDERGIELSDDDYSRMVQLGHVYNVPPEQAFAETDPGRDEEAFAILAQRIAITEGRELTRTELERLAKLDERADLMGEEEVDVSGAIYDLDDSEQIAQYIGERLEAPREETEPSANVIGEDGEERPGFNLDNGDERAAAIDRLMAGESVAGYDSTYEAIEGN